MPGKRGFGVLGGVAKSRTNTMQRERETRLKYFKVYHFVYFTMPFFVWGFMLCASRGSFISDNKLPLVSWGFSAGLSPSPQKQTQTLPERDRHVNMHGLAGNVCLRLPLFVWIIRMELEWGIL